MLIIKLCVEGNIKNNKVVCHLFSYYTIDLNFTLDQYHDFLMLISMELTSDVFHIIINTN